MGVLDGPNNRILKADTKIQEALEALRQFVDNLNAAPDLALRSGVYKGIDPRVVQTVKVDGLVFGYRIEDHQIFMRRVIFMKVPGYKISDIEPDERSRIMTAVFNVFIVPGAGSPGIEMIAPDALKITQDIVPMILVELNPGLVTKAGGWGGKVDN